MSTHVTDQGGETTMLASKSYLGFWIYLMTDCVLFASLFATYAVLRNETFGGPAGYQIFDLQFVLTETLLLLASSFTCGLAIVAAKAGQRKWVMIGLLTTFLLGLGFLGMELSEFSHLAQEGNSWSRSAFLSAFFTLVGTHGLHITVGLVWLSVLGVWMYWRGLSSTLVKRLVLFSLFWHFLDVIWIFIFTIVYLFGVLGI